MSVRSRGIAAAALLASALPAAAQSADPPHEAKARIRHVEADRPTAAALEAPLRDGKQRIERFFGQPFPKPFDVEVFPDRAAFDAYFQKRWQIPQTEPWMVASGVADKLAILSPRVWKSQAAEHDPDDAPHLRELVAHELVHVYHGQHCPRPEFDGMDDAGWFVEGLAVYASGQLEASHRQAAREALQANRGPARLADAWSGRYRYGVSGSLVRYVDERYGRDVVRELLGAVSNEQILERLETTESDLLAAWSEQVSAQP